MTDNIGYTPPVFTTGNIGYSTALEYARRNVNHIYEEFSFDCDEEVLRIDNYRGKGDLYYFLSTESVRK